jgi:hypothetical protein
MILAIAAGFLTLAVAAIRMGWITEPALASSAAFASLGLNVVALALVVRAFELRGYSRSLTAVAAVTLIAIGASLVTGTVEDVDPDLPSAERELGVRRVLGRFLLLCLLGSAISAAVLRHTGDLRAVDPQAETVVRAVLGDRLVPPTSEGPLYSGACFVHDAPSWPDPTKAELIDCGQPHRWQVTTVVDYLERCPSLELPTTARALEMEAGPFQLCLVRFDTDFIGKVGTQDLLADTR